MSEFRMTPLVRTFSLQLSDQGDLPKGLSIVATKEQEDDKRKALQLQEWRDWIRFDGIDDDSTSAKLTHSSKILADTWKAFGTLFDVDCTNCIAGKFIPTIETLQRAVRDANTARESDRKSPMGQVRERFLNFTNTLHDYSFLFSIIPDNDKYTILITGVVSSIAKAAAKYQETAEIISQALDQITRDISQVKKRAKVADTPEVRGFVTDFFVGVFELLCLIMSWYKSKAKRFLGSLIKSFDRDLNGKIDAVQKTLRDLSEETSLITQFRVQDVQEGVADIALTTVNTDRNVQQILEVLEQFVVGIGSLGSLSLKDVGLVTARQLNSIGQDLVSQKAIAYTGHTPHRMIRSSPLIDGTYSGLPVVTSNYKASDRIAPQFSKPDLLQYSQQLKTFIDDGRDFISKDGRVTTISALPHEVVVEMQKWMANINSKLLWVEGTSSHPSEPILSIAALNVCSIAENTGIPCISYFCTPSHGRTRTSQRNVNETHTEATCVSLLYSIILQLCENLPDDFISTEAFDSYFKRLDGTLKSLDVAIDLIKHLFTYLPPLTVWVLDRFPFANTKSTTPFIRKLIDFLRGEPEGRIIKVLFTTEGNTPWLSGNLQAHEHFSASRMALNRPGRFLPGAVSPQFRGEFQKDER